VVVVVVTAEAAAIAADHHPDIHLAQVLVQDLLELPPPPLEEVHQVVLAQMEGVASIEGPTLQV
jgi:hypothetical protein